MRWWRALCARFIPEGLRQAQADHRRAQFTLAAASLFVVLMLVRALGFLVAGEGLQAVVLLLTASVGALAAVIMRGTASHVLPSNLVVSAIWAAGSALAWRRGGFDAQALVALGVVPLAATLLTGRRHGLLWTLVICTEMLGFSLLELAGIELPDQFAASSNFTSRAVGLVLLPVGVYAVTLAYEWTTEATTRALNAAEQKRLSAEHEAQVLRADRLASMGQLVAGVAHELNNPLTYVLGSLGFLEDKLGASAAKREVDQDIRAMREGLERIRTVVRDLKTFTRAEESEEVVSLPAIVASSVRMIENEARHKARVVVDIEPTTPGIRANESRLGQVFVNLLLNAVQAIEPGDPDGNLIRVTAHHTPDGELTVEVIDTGVGMSPEVQRRALEPLYTTKPIGTGTGLGLSVCFNILDMWGGHLALESRIGEGTTVRLTFPPSRLTARPKSIPPATAEPEKTRAEAQADRKRILLIDDDHTVAKVVSRMLRGYDVSIAHSGEDGIALLDSLGEVDVILCDLMMPGLSGVDVYERIAESRPGTERRIVFLTGGAFDPRAQELLERPEIQWLEKPMSPGDLRRIVEEVCEKDP